MSDHRSALASTVKLAENSLYILYGATIATILGFVASAWDTAPAPLLISALTWMQGMLVAAVAYAVLSTVMHYRAQRADKSREPEHKQQSIWEVRFRWVCAVLLFYFITALSIINNMMDYQQFRKVYKVEIPSYTNSI